MDTPLEDVERDLLLWAGRVAAGEAELLRLIGEWDAREGWGAAGALSCAKWLSWKVGFSPGTARERVRVARALRDLPKTAARMAEGGVSYAQVRAISRVATEADEQMWLDLAGQTTAEQLEKAVRGVKRALQPAADADADPEDIEFRDRVRQRWDERGNLELTVVIPAVHAPAAIAALEQSQAAVRAERDQQLAEITAKLAEGVPAGTPKAPEEYHFVDPDYPVFPQRVGLFDPTPERDAAVAAYWEERRSGQAKAQAWQEHQNKLLEEAARQGALTRKATLTDGFLRLLTGGAITVRPLLLIDPMSGWARTTKDELLPPAITAALLTGQTMPRIRPIRPDDLLRYDQGRDSRLVTPKLRQLLGHLDGECCRFPGCTRTKKLQAHHVVYWRNGGRTDLANLALVCSRHHTLIHEQGFVLELRADRTLRVTTREGTRLEHLPRQPWQPKEQLTGQAITASQWNGDRLDLHHVAWVLAQHAA